MRSIEKENLIYIKEEFFKLTKYYLDKGVPLQELEKVIIKRRSRIHHNKLIYFISFFIIFIAILYQLIDINLISYILIHIRGVRCLIPNNYFVWEATRQISNCSFCLGVTEPIILNNASRKEFEPYAYSSKPIIIRRAFLHWPAMKIFNFKYFKDLYDNNEEAYKSVDEECQFLHFKSDFTSLRDVFSMNDDRISNKPEQKSWYVGWGNCHPKILSQMRKHYPKPHFLPENCEMPSKEYVFMGYGAGATMHLDFINRLMWQAQLQGVKTWLIRPAPECEAVCQEISFNVEPGDAVLLDTRVWYHGTTVNRDQFSLSIQSEYG